VIVDWFDASRGDPVADVARTSLTLLGDGAQAPRHLPGSDRQTLVVLTEAYFARLREALEIGEDLLTRWQAIQAVARMAEGVPRGVLSEVWKRFVNTGGLAHSIRGGADAGQRPAAQAAGN
jgi:hypothetical protein